MQNKEMFLLPLWQQLNQLSPVSNELQEFLLAGFSIQHFKKGTLLLEEENICTHLWFLIDGLLRSYHTIGENEMTSRIMFTNHVVISPGSFFTQTPAIESIETLSDCTVATLSYTYLQSVYKNFPEFNYHTRIITEQYFYKQEQRLYMLRKPDAKSKYEYFFKNYSEYLNEIPQKYIASFLGIARETFNRVRNDRGKLKQ